VALALALAALGWPACGAGSARVSPRGPVATPSIERIDVQRLLESGRYHDAVTRWALPPDAPDLRTAYLVASCWLRLDNRDAARDWYGFLTDERQPDSWRVTGRLALSRVSADRSAIDTLVVEARQLTGDALTQYELGLALLDRSQFAEASAAFGRALALDPTFAYAHYYAGMVAERQGRAADLVAHLQTFIRLAPNAPERPGVEAILRTVRGS
jgi:tetratricopeptide (TPR) repeat protein